MVLPPFYTIQIARPFFYCEIEMEILATKVVRQISGKKKFLFYSSKNLFVTYIHSSLLLFDDELLERICRFQGSSAPGRFDFSKVPIMIYD